MEQILQWGLDVIGSFQVIRTPMVDRIFFFITFLGNEEFYLLFLPLLYWSIDREKGFRLTIVVLFSNFLNHGLKEVFAQPRPYDLDPSLGIGDTGGYGLPSGHSQGSVTFWGTIAPWFKGGWPLAVVIPLLVGLSRIYLGVHFPTDVFAGWAVGIVFLIFYYTLGDRISSFLTALSWKTQLLISLGISLIVFIINYTDSTTPSVLLGASIGYVLMIRFSPFSTGGTIGKRILRYVAGLFGALLIYLGLKMIFPGEGERAYLFFRIVRYTLLGFWVTFGAPYLFKLTKLADAEVFSG